MHIATGAPSLGLLPRNYTLGAANYDLKSLIHEAISETLGELMSYIPGIGSVMEPLVENIVTSLAMKGLNKLEDFKGVTTTQQFITDLKFAAMDYLTEDLGLIPLYVEGSDESLTPQWNPGSHSGNMIGDVVAGLLEQGIKSLINKIAEKLGAEEIPEPGDGDGWGDGGFLEKADNMDVIDTGHYTEAKNQPMVRANLPGSSSGMILPLAIGGAALLFFMGKK